MTTDRAQTLGNDETAEDQDWCSGCDRLTYWDGETCRACGHTWGSA